MYFSSFTCLLLGLAATCTVHAAPAAEQGGLAWYAREPRQAASGRQPYTPRLVNRANKGKSNKKGKNSKNKDVEVDITVTDLIIDEQTNGTEIQFEEKVTQILIKNKTNNKKKNDKRKNSMKTKNKKKDTVIQIVQIIIDVQSGSTRYAVSSLLADNGSNVTTTCQMTDSQTMTIGAGNCSIAAVATDASAALLADGTATATAAMAAATGVDVGAPFNMANQTLLLPAGAPAPVAAAGVEVMPDPAADIGSNSTSICGK